MDARFNLDPRGVLTPADPEAKKALAGRSGDFLLASTGPDLLCLVREKPVGGKVAAPRVAMAGDAASFPLADLVAFLGQARWSGVVRVHAPGGRRSILLREGEVRGATSDEPSERIGELIVRLGFATRERLEEILRDTPPSKVGRTLVEKGALQPHELFKCLTEQVAEIFHAILLCQEGAFTLVDQVFDDKVLHSLNLSMQSLLMDSIRKIDEMAHFRKRIPHGRVCVAKKRPSDGKLETEEDVVLGLVDGRRTVVELGQAAKLNEFDVTRVVFRLLEGGYAQIIDKPAQGVAVVAPAVAPAKPVARGLALDARAVIRIFNLIFREIRDEVAKKSMDKEFVAAANAALTGKALSQSPVLAGILFDASCSLPEAALLEQYERMKPTLGTEPLASFREALSDVMFFLLFQAGELLESRADEELARRVKEMLAAIEGP
ncbi:MAG: DUF4388 domain-containing protein [Myxococcaceae bacterium]